MKRIFAFIFFFVLCTCLAGRQALFSATVFAINDKYSPEEILVKFSPGASVSQIGNYNQKFKTSIKERLNLSSIFVIKVPKGSEEALAKLFSTLPMVEFAEPNFEVEALSVPNDSYFSQQWGLSMIKAPEAWDKVIGSSSVKIAIVDTGIDNNHPDLISNVDTWVNFSSSRSSDDLYGHGTHVAGIASSVTNNSMGVAGLGYNSHLLSVKVLSDSGTGYVSQIANGIVWSSDNGAKVINLSLGSSSASKTMEDAINYAWNKGVLLSCAAGNNNRSTASYPAYYQNCIAVAATDKNDQKASWSNYGSWVDVAAPGLDIFSTLPNHKAKISSTRNYGSVSGTSMATPFVSGLAALIFSQNPSLTNSQVRSIIENTTDKITGTGNYWVFGRINAAGAVGGTEIPTVTPTPLIQPTENPPIVLTPTNTPVPTQIPTLNPVPTNTPIPTPTSTPSSPTPTPIPWWCKYFPSRCQ